MVLAPACMRGHAASFTSSDQVQASRTLHVVRDSLSQAHPEVFVEAKEKKPLSFANLPPDALQRIIYHYVYSDKGELYRILAPYHQALSRFRTMASICRNLRREAAYYFHRNAGGFPLSCFVGVNMCNLLDDEERLEWRREQKMVFRMMMHLQKYRSRRGKVMVHRYHIEEGKIMWELSVEETSYRQAILGPRPIPSEAQSLC